MFQILSSILGLLRPQSPPVVAVAPIPWRIRESLLVVPLAIPMCRVTRTHQASFCDRDGRDCWGSGTLRPPTRRLDGYGRASETFEVEAYGR
jgi:hypothetical protein